MDKGLEKNITIADVAEALGVSKTTVSRAISGKGRIGRETRERVLAYIEEHDYKPNVIAKGLAQSKTYNICVVMPGEYDVVDLTFFQECLFGIQEIAGSMEYDILLSICRKNDISSLERIIANHKVDGVILMRTFVEDEQIDFLQTKNVPFVTIGSTSANYKGVIQIDHNHKSACKELTSIILMKQMDKIALIGGNEEHVVTQSRLRGFREAYAKMGKTLDVDLMFLSQDNQVLVEKAVKEALNRQADCILCMDDAVCSRVLKTLRQQHVKVPEDVRVASFYNSMVLENNVPFFGICLGMQCAVIEFARHVVGIEEANSEEFNPFAKDKLIYLMTEWYDFRKKAVERRDAESDKGGTMRLGAYPCAISEGTHAFEAYKTANINERHRHRYEFNNAYRERLADMGMVFSGQSPDGTLVEIVEIPDHPWFLGCQFHPEFQSRPMKPHPLFKDFIRASCLARKK